MSSTKERVQMFGILMIVKVAYTYLLRPLVKKAVDNPDEEWDDALMEILDRLFNYKKAE